MSPFAHRPLAHAGEQIRLLRFCGTETSKYGLEFELSTWDFGTAPPYVAASYTWGSPEDLCDITIDGGSYTVRQNCFDALIQIRRQAPDAYVWTDSICINQSDLNEKGLQVGMMGDIYEWAEVVYSCLGEHADGSEDIMRQFRELAPYARNHWSEDTIRTVTEQFYRVEPHIGDDPRRGANRVPSHAYKAFGERTYWHRMWIVQEVRVAQRCVLLCGSDHLPLEHVRLCLEKIGRDSRKPRGYPKMWYVIQGDNDESFRAEHLAPIAPISLSLAISRYRDQECSDKRDRLYALAKLVEWPKDVQPPRPNYRITPWDLAHDFLQQLQNCDWIAHDCSRAISELITSFNITVRDQQVRHALAERAIIPRSSGSKPSAPSTKAPLYVSDARYGSINGVRISCSADKELQVVKTYPWQIESTISNIASEAQSRVTEDSEDIGSELWAGERLIGFTCPRTRSGDWLILLSPGSGGGSSNWLIIRENAPRQALEIIGTATAVNQCREWDNFYFDLFDVGSFPKDLEKFPTFDVWFDEDDLLLWVAYTNSVHEELLSNDELSDFLRYPVAKCPLSSYAVFRRGGHSLSMGLESDTDESRYSLDLEYGSSRGQW